jgi:hypothetical protein
VSRAAATATMPSAEKVSGRRSQRKNPLLTFAHIRLAMPSITGSETSQMIDSRRWWAEVPPTPPATS